MTKKEFKILTRVLKELGVYNNYFKDLRTKNKPGIVEFKKRMSMYDLHSVIDQSLYWINTTKGFTFWKNVHSFFLYNSNGFRKGGQTLLEYIESFKLDNDAK